MDLSALDEEIKKLKPPKISSLSLDEEIANLKPPGITTPQTRGVYPATPEFWETPLPKQQVEDQYLNPSELTSMTAIAKAGLARQPETKMRIFAESRGIPVEKYKVNEEGDIVFQGPDNKWYREETTGIGPASRRFVTEAVTDPVNLLATAAGIAAGGFTGGIGALPVRMAIAQGLGAAGGEYLRQLMAEQLLGEEPETIGQKTLKVATAGAGGLAGEALGVKGAQLGSAVSRTVARAFGSKTPTKKAIQTLANVGLTKPEQIQSIIDTQETAKKFGISLNILEAAADNNPLAISALKKVAQTSPVQALERNPLLRRGVAGYLEDILPKKIEQPSLQTRDYVRAQLKDNEKFVKDVVDPFYTQAFAGNPKVDTTPILNEIALLSNPKIATLERQRILKEIGKDLDFKKEIVDDIVSLPLEAQQKAKDIIRNTLEARRKKLDIQVDDWVSGKEVPIIDEIPSKPIEISPPGTEVPTTIPFTRQFEPIERGELTPSNIGKWTKMPSELDTAIAKTYKNPSEASRLIRSTLESFKLKMEEGLPSKIKKTPQTIGEYWRKTQKKYGLPVEYNTLYDNIEPTVSRVPAEDWIPGLADRGPSYTEIPSLSEKEISNVADILLNKLQGMRKSIQSPQAKIAEGDVVSFINNFKYGAPGVKITPEVQVSPEQRAVIENFKYRWKVPIGSFSIDDLVKVQNELDTAIAMTGKELPIEKIRPQGVALSKINQLKTKLDQIISGSYQPSAKSFTKSVNEPLKTIRKMIIAEADKVSPAYRKARKISELLIEGSSRLKSTSPYYAKEYALHGDVLRTQKEILEKVSDRELSDIGTYILSSNKSNPQAVGAIKASVINRPNGKELWDSSVNQYINEVTATIPFKENAEMDFGVKLWKAVLGDEKKQAIMKAALDPTQYKALTNLMDIYRRTGLVFKTSPLVPITEKGPKTLVEMVVSLARPMRTIQNVVGDNVLIALRQGDIKSLVDIIYDPQGAQRLAKINKKQHIDQLLNNFISIMGWTAGREAVTELEE